MSGFEDLDDETLDYYLEVQKKHKEIKKLRKEGKTLEEIAKIIGWNLTTITVVVNNQETARKIYIKNRRITPKGIKKINTLRETGKTLNEISQIIGCSPSSVSRILKKSQKG